jgi:hexulose-6-phosphate isomerase
MPFRKSVGSDMLPGGVPYHDVFPLVVAAGFEAIEMRAVADESEAAEAREAAECAGLKIHSVLTEENWLHPLSSTSREEVQKGVRALRTALANARLWGADTVLVIPALVNATTSYGDAYTRSQDVIRNELLPIARELGIVLGIENVWNGFLLSPLEYARYIDEFESPWVRAYLDLGNMIFGHPEHWVRIAGSRIVKVHIKDFRLDRARRTIAFGKLGDGAIDWAAVRAALIEVGFSSYVTSTGIPRGQLHRWIDRGARYSRKRLGGMPGVSRLEGALSALRRREETLFLHDAAQRFDRFRDGRLTTS